MNNIQRALCEAVLAQQKNTELNSANDAELAAISEALAETTTLERSQIESVLGDLRDREAQLDTASRPPFIKMPVVKSFYVRIGIYMVCGLLGYSVYKSAEMNELKIEHRHDYRVQNTIVEFQLGIAGTRAIFTNAYHTHYQKRQKFPATLNELNAGLNITRTLKGSDLISGYDLRADGRIILNLAESFGYHRWVQLTPEIIPHPLWLKIGFECTSNAEKRLLKQNGSAWCNYAPGKRPA